MYFFVCECGWVDVGNEVPLLVSFEEGLQLVARCLEWREAHRHTAKRFEGIILYRRHRLLFRERLRGEERLYDLRQGVWGFPILLACSAVYLIL